MKSITLSILLLFLFFACKQSQEQGHSSTTETVQVFRGQTMGTYYQVSYVGEKREKLPSAIDSLLEVLDFELSTYNPNSVISSVNKGENFLTISSEQTTAHFIYNFNRAKEIYQLTKGFFDPSVMPLVNYWGFGYDPNATVKTVDSLTVDSIRQFVGFDKITLEVTETIAATWLVEKENPSVQIDFSAIAKGYGVDQLAQLLEEKGIENYLIDIGGEVVGMGQKGNENPWVVGIAIPLEDASLSDYMAAVPVKNVAIASSGNYRNFHEIGGVKYSHTINPFTGFPERSRLLSASIMAADCATADAFATACMVAGLEKGFEMVDSIPALEAFFIFSDENGQLSTKATSGFPETK